MQAVLLHIQPAYLLAGDIVEVRDAAAHALGVWESLLEAYSHLEQIHCFPVAAR